MKSVSDNTRNTAVTGDPGRLPTQGKLEAFQQLADELVRDTIEDIVERGHDGGFKRKEITEVVLTAANVFEESYDVVGEVFSKRDGDTGETEEGVNVLDQNAAVVVAVDGAVADHVERFASDVVVAFHEMGLDIQKLNGRKISFLVQVEGVCEVEKHGQIQFDPEAVDAVLDAVSPRVTH